MFILHRHMYLTSTDSKHTLLFDSMARWRESLVLFKAPRGLARDAAAIAYILCMDRAMGARSQALRARSDSPV